MKRLYFPLSIFLSCWLMLSISPMHGQSNNICDNGDCSAEIRTVDLGVPLQANSGALNATERTEKFKAAYLKTKTLKQGYAQTPQWNEKYNSFGLKGEECLRLYQLESQFAYEYEQNPAFKAFIDQQEKDVAAFKKRGFDAARRGVNLQTRMKDKCPSKVKSLANKKGLSEADLLAAYRKLGVVQGYFDEDGNLLKPLDEQQASGPLAALNAKLNQLPVGVKLPKKLQGLAKGLQAIKGKLGGIGKFLNGVKARLGNLFSGASGIRNKLGKLAQAHNRIKNALPKLPKPDFFNKLLKRGKDLADQFQAHVGKLDQLKDAIDQIGKEAENIQNQINQGSGKLDQLKDRLKQLQEQKDKLATQMKDPKAAIDALQGQLDALTKDSDKLAEEAEKEEEEQGLLGGLLDKLLQAQADGEEKLKELEAAAEQLDQAYEALAKDTEAAEEEIAEQAEREASLEAAEAALKEEYGTDISLEPVPVTEWAESFEVERPYWDAVFHPDDEVVEGYKGRYFEIRLKNAEKQVKLLFEPGKYFMEKSDFRNNYGSTIGAFVREALHYLKKAEQDQVQIFVQGSADIAGHQTFKGNQDTRYLYESVSLLPYQAEQDRFGSQPTEKQIPPQAFNNTHLPDLRGQYLKEMITVYSKKLKPVLLEGVVKKVESEGDRNAVIYLYLPESLLAEYEEN